MRETGRAARILQIGDVVGLGLGQRCDRRLAHGKLGPVDPDGPRQTRGLAGHLREFRREDQHLRVAARKLDAELFDVRIATAERGRQRQRHGPCAGIDNAEEQRGELRAGLGDQRDAVGRGHAGGDQAIGHRAGVGAQLRIGVGLRQCSARVVEIKSPVTACRVIEGFAQRAEIGEAARQGVLGRRRNDRRYGRAALVGRVGRHRSSCLGWSRCSHTHLSSI